MITPEQLAESGSEHAHQTALFCWVNIAARFGAEIANEPAAYSGKLKNIAQGSFPIPQLELMFAIPNGGERNKAVAASLKAEGVKSGVPDIFLPIRQDIGEDIVYCGLFIEMKKQVYRNARNGGCSDAQLAMIAALRAQSYAVEVCYTWQEARDVILKYLGKT